MKKYVIFTLLLLLILTVTGCAAEPVENSILSAEIKSNGEQVSVKAALTDEYITEHKGEQVYLLALDSCHTDSLTSYTVVGSSKPRNNLSFRFDLETDAGNSLLCSAFVLAQLTSGEASTGTYKAVTSAFYISNPSENAASAKRPQSSAGIKGISTDDIYSAEMMGAEHILLEADINELLLPTYSEGAINHVFDGVSYYFDSAKVTALDKQVSEACDLKLRVYLRTSLQYPEEGEEPITALYCPGATYGQQGYLPNMESKVGAGYVKAFYDFLAQRYSGEKGLVLDYVIGEDVNDLAASCNAGSYSIERVQDNYLSWVRSAYNILSSQSKNTTVYISVDNHMRSEDTSSAVGTKVFLTTFATKAKSSGDFPWSIALSLGDGNDLSAILAGDSKDYSNIGINNLHDLLDLLEQDVMLCNGNRRSAIIDSLALSNSVSEANRAAYYTYAYYKAADAGFDALIYNAGSSDSTLTNANGERKEFYYAFLMCGSNTATQLKSFTDKIPTANSLKFKELCTRYLSYEQEITTEVGRAVSKNKKEFPATLRDFVAAAGTVNAELGKNDSTGAQTLTVKGDASSTYVAISCFDISASDLIESGYVGITMSSPTATRIALIISDKALPNGESAVYIGEATVHNSAIYYFNITPFTESIKSSDSLQISLCVLPEENSGNVTLEIEELALYGSSGNGISTVVSVIVVIISTLSVCGLLFILTQRRKKQLRHTSED
ncbi:MAG: hypothetical protein IJY39_14665 [Clostridia bacterium]|nr:hypothetical protein [Clostridia bacterium]